MKKLILALSLVSASLMTCTANASFFVNPVNHMVTIPVNDCCVSDNTLHSNVTFNIYSLQAADVLVVTTSFQIKAKATDVAGYIPITSKMRGTGADSSTYSDHAVVNESCMYIGVNVTPSVITTNWNITADTHTLVDGYYIQNVDVTCRYGL